MFPSVPISHPLEQPLFDLELDLVRGIVRPCGDLDYATAPLALAAIQAIRSERPGDLTIDLADVNMICEDGLDAIVAIAVAQQGANHELVLVNANARVKRTLLASGMVNLLDHTSAKSSSAGPQPLGRDGDQTGDAEAVEDKHGQ